MKRMKCPICGNYQMEKVNSIEYVDLIINKGTISYIQNISICERCNFVYVENPLSDNELECLYKQLSKYESCQNVGREDSDKQKRYLRQKDFIFGAGGVELKSLLEIGAATGSNLNIYKEEGVKVKGIEPSKNNRTYALSEYGIELESMTLDEYFAQYHDIEKFDLVFLSLILEHIVDIQGFMDKVDMLSKKYVFIEVPIIESMGYATEPYGMFFYEHVNYFSIESLFFLMHSKGYRERRINIEFNYCGEVHPGFPTIVTLWEKGMVEIQKDIIGWEYSAKRLIQDYFDISEKRFQGIVDKISGITNKEKIAIWGTGSHTSKLLGLTNLRDKNIVRFYDSDIKKRGMKMLGVEIIPFSVEDLLLQKVDTIIISTYSAEKTIFHYILENHIDEMCNVITLYH